MKLYRQREGNVDREKKSPVDAVRQSQRFPEKILL